MSQPKSKQIGDIQRLTERLGWSTVQLARESGVSQRTVYNVLHGVSDTTTVRAEAMLRALEAASKKIPQAP